MRRAHFPGRAPIDAYGDGGFRFADMSHRGSILCLPSGIYSWRPQGAAPDVQDLEQVFAEAAGIDILFIGTGKQMILLPDKTQQALREENIIFEVMDTGAAVRSLNILLSEERNVAAALYAVD